MNNVFPVNHFSCPAKLIFALALIVCIPFKTISQESKTEAEIEKELSLIKNDSVKIIAILKFSKRLHGTSSLPLKYATKALRLAESYGSARLLVTTIESVGDAYWYGHNFEKASEYYFKELRFADSLGLKRSKARAYYNIGWIKCLQQDSYKDRNYLIKALRTFESLRDTSSVFEVSHALAGTYENMSFSEPKYVDSALFYFRNLIFFAENYHQEGYNVILHANYAQFLTQIGRYKEAKKYLIKCCEVALANKDTSNYAVSRHYLAGLYIKTDSLDKAKRIYDEVIPLLHSAFQIGSLSNAYSNRSDIFRYKKQYREALEDHILYKKYADSLEKSIFRSNLLEKESQYEIEKRESDIRKLEHENEVSELKNKQNRYVIIGLVFIALLVVIITLNLLRNNRAKQKANQLLNQKNRLIEEQKKEVEERNLDITNSINYAKRIQEAILPSKEIKYRLFPEAFVLFSPKDIVSGDFYWFAEKNGKRIISAVDCTGHGVPGAFMSLIGNTFLHEAVIEKGITEPALILNELRNNVIFSLKQTDVIDSTKDGMDMALLSFNDTNNTVEFAGANNPLWLIRNGECIEYKADKRPIGYFRGQGLSFTNHVIELKKGDTLYVFTDGYADQFGGPDGKKLKYKQFRDFLLSIQHLPMTKQESFLTEKFNAWKGALEQVDDVCVIGIRV